MINRLKGLLRIRVWGLGVQGVGFRAWGLGRWSRVWDLGLRDWGIGLGFSD